MKKTLSLILALTLSLALAVPAYATDKPLYHGSEESSLLLFSEKHIVKGMPTEESGVITYDVASGETYTERFGLKTKDGTIVVKPEYERIEYLGFERYELYREKMYYIIDNTGREIFRRGNSLNVVIPINGTYIYLSQSPRDNADALRQSLSGSNVAPQIYDETGKVTEYRYDYMDYTGSGQFIVRMQGKYGLYRYGTGELVSCKYSAMREIDSEYAVPQDDNEKIDLFVVFDENRNQGVIDSQGNVILPLKERDYSIDRYYKGYYTTVKGLGETDFGLLDAQGNELIPYTYRYLTVEENRLKLWVVVDKVKNGGTYELKYDYVYFDIDTPSTPFIDIPVDAYYADAVEWAVENGITNGMSRIAFTPNSTCTTAQILTFLHRAKGSPAPTQGNPYADVKSSDYFYNAALWARENGLTGDGSFNGGTPCTRAAVVTYLWKLAGKPSAGSADFSDVPASADYAQAVAWAVAQGITNGTGDTTFSPDATCTRGQIVTFLYRAYAK